MAAARLGAGIDTGLAGGNVAGAHHRDLRNGGGQQAECFSNVGGLG